MEIKSTNFLTAAELDLLKYFSIAYKLSNVIAASCVFKYREYCPCGFTDIYENAFVMCHLKCFIL